MTSNWFGDPSIMKSQMKLYGLVYKNTLREVDLGSRFIQVLSNVNLQLKNSHNVLIEFATWGLCPVTARKSVNTVGFSRTILD